MKIIGLFPLTGNGGIASGQRSLQRLFLMKRISSPSWMFRLLCQEQAD